MNLFSRKSVASVILPSPSSSSPEAFAQNSSYGKGFYEPGQYHVALKRCENGHDLASQLCEMFDERSQIEMAYVNSLKTWSKKWHGELVKSQEYGTNKKVWDQTVTTGEQMADVHSTMASNLSDSIIPKLRQWRKDNYEKSLIHYKKTKEFEKDFDSVQKSWTKLLDKIQESKQSYYQACKTLKQTEINERNATDDDQRRKLADKVDVAKREVSFARTKYEQTLKDMIDQRPHYEQQMAEVFQRTQQFEKKRLDFFKETYSEYGKSLDINNNPILRKMYDDYQQNLQTHDSQQDITWWDQNYGTQTNCRWPEFEEYREEK
ncbi:unnamed protein product [Didymodactylos carnosus]|uniref:F-BAR domain-containing protein n=1 Tax=Didymodactylos carnosus TaxID=1234261 RepID=A0A814TFE2_9BILA|nr:unnamed protein product [Didymodactylos carnosus]CAF1161006.1 unnamed protein product [Didymodactylos carnosus]CAF3552120.1 unnamed protein product [Didymodactylos carnosus]CAF3924635.1 unnamed protein product [Didymodactylos carnosus]